MKFLGINVGGCPNCFSWHVNKKSNGFIRLRYFFPRLSFASERRAVGLVIGSGSECRAYARITCSGAGGDSKPFRVAAPRSSQRGLIEISGYLI